MANGRSYKVFVSFVLAFLLSLVTYQNSQAVDIVSYTTVTYPLNYDKVTQSLLSPRGEKTTDSDLYFLACIARKHLERKEDISDTFQLYPTRIITPTQEQIEVVKSVINNPKNECYDLYIVLPLYMIEKDDVALDYIIVISNSLAFMNYKTYILFTVKPNL